MYIKRSFAALIFLCYRSDVCGQVESWAVQRLAVAGLVAGVFISAGCAPDELTDATPAAGAPAHFRPVSFFLLPWKWSRLGKGDPHHVKKNPPADETTS